MFSVRASDKRIACDEEFSDSEDEGEVKKKHHENMKAKRMKLDDEVKTPASSTGECCHLRKNTITNSCVI